MYYPELMQDGNTRSMIDTWLGYNHNFRVAAGEFYDMENMSSDGFPVLVPRQRRILLKDLKAEAKAKKEEISKTIRGMLFTEDTLCYIEDSLFHYGSKTVDLGVTVSADQTMLRFGTSVLIYPLGLYVDVEQTPMQVGSMAQVYVLPNGKHITITICTVDGSDYDHVTIGDEAPANPNDGDYWVCTLSTTPGLNIWYKSLSSWQPVASSYLRVEIEGANLTSMFSVGDAIYMNLPHNDDKLRGLDVDLINNGSIIQAMTNDYIVVQGILTGGKASVDYDTPIQESMAIKMERRLPKLDYVCADKNRVWGCHYGYENGELINEIYCTKLGDFKNWNVYQGLATDSYAATVGAPGPWTGCISYGGYPTFFKENAIFRVYGSFPAEYIVNQIDARGVQAGSHRSLAIIGEYLYYKAGGNAVMVWDGSIPRMISDQLGKGQYFYDGVAGVVDGKYHLVVTNRLNGYRYFVYDSQNGVWTRESSLPVKWFSWSLSGQLYAATSSEVYGLGSTDNIEYVNKLVGEEYVEWFAQTGDFGYEYPDYKYVSRLTLRAYVPYRSEVQLQISYDDGPWEDVGVIRGNDGIMSQSLSIVPYRCDHYKLKLSGHGDVRIYTLATTLETGSEENANSYR